MSAIGTSVAPPGVVTPLNHKLLRSCVGLWLLGLIGMWIVRAVLVLEPHTLPFQVAAGFWILGGIGYTGLGLLALVAGPGHGPTH